MFTQNAADARSAVSLFAPVTALLRTQAGTGGIVEQGTGSVNSSN